MLDQVSCRRRMAHRGDGTMRYEDGSFYRFPERRWSFSNWRQFRPTVTVCRGTVTPAPLPEAGRRDLDDVRFTPIGGGTAMSWYESLDTNYTDGILVLHRGHIVYERYFGALTADQPHIAFSVTKSFFGTLAATLIAEGSLDASALISSYVPELATSAFGDASVAEVLDMTTALDFVEDYAEPPPTMARYRRATGFMPRAPTDDGPRSIHEFLPTLTGDGVHGDAFRYRTPNTDVVGWLIARATGHSPAEVLQERIWSRIGAEGDAYLAVDDAGTPLAGSGLNLRLRDLARFGEMMRLRGRFNGQQVVPATVVDDIRRGGSRAAFAKAGYSTLPGWSYRCHWWISHDDHGVFAARGIHGQAVLVDPAAEMVITRFASHPRAANADIDPTSLPAYRAVAEHLMRVPHPPG
jgi:CubicO group peptidase (beta-lactamase class C family)